MPNIAEILREATGVLQAGGIAEPRREANSLLAFALEKDKTFLIAHSEYNLTEAEEKRFREFIRRRSGYEPFQYITGKQEFYGLDFTVTPDVLIPRPETELIVEEAVGILKTLATGRFCEVGTGSGCISVAILHEVETSFAIGLDISEKALEIARLNAEKNKVSERLKLKVSDIFAVLENEKNEKFDLIVSNPPYIPVEEIETLQPEVGRFEPLTALTDGQDGLSIIEKIIAGAPSFLVPGGFLLMEIGFNQSTEVRRMVDPMVWHGAEFFPDLQGIPRMLRARLAG